MTVERMLPLYQGMMTTFYDHRAADVVKSESAAQRQNQPRYLTDEEKANPARPALPQYWIRENLLDAELPDWLIGFSKLTAATNERTLVPTPIPRFGAGDSFQFVLPSRFESALTPCLLACMGAFVVDYQARQKLSGTNLNYFHVRQLAVLPPRRFEEPCPWASEQALSTWIAPRVAELVATANDMVQVAERLGVEGAPFRWDPERRMLLRCELDAAFFHIYGLSRDDTEYVMDTFPIVKRKDEAAHGEYRTKRLILEVYDEMAKAARSGTTYQTRLSPPPADLRVAHPKRSP